MAPKPVSLEQARNIAKLYTSFDAFMALCPRTDAQVAKMLLELWASFPIGSPQSALIENAVERLKRTGLGALEVERG